MSTTATIPDLKRGISLNAPPRRVPLLRLQLMFGNVPAVIGAVSLPILPVAFYGTALVGGGPIPFVAFGMMGAIFILGGGAQSIRAMRLLREGRLGRARGAARIRPERRDAPLGGRTSLAIALVLPICAAFVFVCVGALGWFPDPDELVRYVN